MNVYAYNAPDSGISMAKFLAAVLACQEQLKKHVEPSYGYEGNNLLALEGMPHDLPPGAALLIVTKDIHEPGAQGYHTLVKGEGVLAMVSTEGVDEAGFTNCLSHEVIEMVIDPGCDAYFSGNPVGARPSLEPGDPVEATSYLCRGEMVSNFVLPAWGRPNAGGRFDWMGLCKRPGEILAGGYVVYEDGTTEPPDLAERLPARKRHVHSRVIRRMGVRA